MEKTSLAIGPLVKIWRGAVHWFRNVPRASRHAQQGMKGAIKPKLPGQRGQA